MTKLTPGARVALAFWALAGVFVWAVADTETEFDKQVRVRCEQLGGTVQKNVDGSLTCGARKLARV